MISYLKSMRRKDLETRTKTLLEVIHGLMALIGRGSMRVPFPFLKQ